jgi:hypothetical protein
MTATSPPTVPVQPPESPPPKSRKGIKIAAAIIGALVLLGGAVAVVLAGFGGGGSSTQAVQGQIIGGTQAAATVFSATGGGSGICGGAVAGTQVIIKGPSGKLLVTTNLRKDAKATSALSIPAGLSVGQIGIYDFSATIPAGSGPYTVDVVGVSSIVVSGKSLRHLQLSC